MTEQRSRLWIGTSWKMNKTLSEALSFADNLLSAESIQSSRIQRFVIPSFTAVREVKARLAGSSVKVGAQNMHWSSEGPWTGEVSPTQLVDCGLDIVELGHSERRSHFGESHETVALKVRAAIEHGLLPLVCVGETLDQKNAGLASEVLIEEVSSALSKLEAHHTAHEILFAYEPVWAIGEAGVPASAEYADDMHRIIKSTAEKILRRNTPCLYGGSVNAENCEELIQCEHINGLFIGRSAWCVEGYLDILKRCSSVI